MWSLPDMADALHAGFTRRAHDDDLEQAVYGFDALDELGLHPLIGQSLRDAGYGAWPEQRYPGDDTRTRRSEGKRCDLVLTPPPRALPLRDAAVKGTLFGLAPACDLEDAFWLEVKTVAQHEPEGPFRRYSAELMQPVTADVAKLWRDPLIRHAGLLLILFTQEPDVADHDLTAWHTRCLDKRLPVATPITRQLRLTDRIGNACCTLALFGVRGTH